MDFIEQIFHVAPDGGSGFLEYSIFFVLLISALALPMIRARVGVRAWRQHSIEAWIQRAVWGER